MLAPDAEAVGAPGWLDGPGPAVAPWALAGGAGDAAVVWPPKSPP